MLAEYKKKKCSLNNIKFKQWKGLDIETNICYYRSASNLINLNITLVIIQQRNYKIINVYNNQLHYLLRLITML